MKRMNHWGVIGLLAASLLTGCGLDPVQPDQDITLQPGYGIAAVAIDTLDPLNGIYFKELDNKSAPDIEISHVSAGVHLMIFAIPAGTYCATRYSFGDYYFTQTNPRDTCFDVVAGKVAYSGNIGPRARNGRAYLYQNYEWAAFKKTFNEQYPKLAQYPIITP
jgi:hypothetical protein